MKIGHEQRLKMNRSTRREAGTNWQTEQQQLTRTGWYLPKNSAGAEDRRDLMANKICNLWLKWAAMLEACRLATVLGLKKVSRDLGNYRSWSFIPLSVNLVKTIIKNSL